jgi:penicillin-binding protein 1A
MLEGIKAAGKTGTTNSYRDAWFVGYTGNFVCGIWYGNDDYSPLNRMTGGSLPAQTWHDIMAYAHQGIELHTVAGLGKNNATVGPILDKEGKGEAPIRPAMLTHKGLETLLRVEQLMDEAGRQMTARGPAVPSPRATPQSTPASTSPPAHAGEKVGARGDGKTGGKVGSVTTAAQ